jgi:hypothetical protein
MPQSVAGERRFDAPRGRLRTPASIDADPRDAAFTPALVAERPTRSRAQVRACVSGLA